MYPRVVNQYESQAGKPYRPSNGTEGMIFMDAFCGQCFHDRCQDCEIVAMTMAYDLTDEEYPKEWVYDNEGWPICTKWQKWDSGAGEEPTEPEPDDPNQLMFPFMIDEIIQTPA